MSREKAAVVSEHKVTLKIAQREEGWFLETDLYRYLPETETRLISTGNLGEAFEPEQKFENPDGTPILLAEDYFGASCGLRPFRVLLPLQTRRQFSRRTHRRIPHYFS